MPKTQVVENPIDVRVMDVLVTLKNNLKKFGGDPEVLVVSERDHQERLHLAAEVIGMRVAVRAWAPDSRFLILSERDLRDRDDRYP